MITPILVSTSVHATSRAVAMTVTLMLAASAHANGIADSSRASINASVALPVMLVGGTSQFFRDAGQLSVTLVKITGNISTITLRGLASGADASVQVSGKVIEGSAIAAGAILQTSLSATGTLLIASGKVLMFIPNETGLALLHHSRARDSY